VLNNLEFDHADIFRDLADVQRTFSHLTRIVPRSGAIILNGDDPIWPRSARSHGRGGAGGVGGANDVRIATSGIAGGGGVRAFLAGRRLGASPLDADRLYNARNAAMAATAAGLALDPADPRGLRLEALGRFRGSSAGRRSGPPCRG